MQHKPTSGPRFVISVYSIVLVMLFLSALYIPKGMDILLINGNHSPFQDWFFAWFTFTGDGIIFIPVIIYFLFVRYTQSVFTVSVAAALGLLISLFKRILFFDAGRPITFLDSNALHFVPDVTVHAHHSFPSGHTATAFAVAVLISLLTQKKSVTLLMVVYAVLVGYSRIYLLQHFLIDVAAGAIVGSFTAATLYFCAARIKVNDRWHGKLTLRKMTRPTTETSNTFNSQLEG